MFHGVVLLEPSVEESVVSLQILDRARGGCDRLLLSRSKTSILPRHGVQRGCYLVASDGMVRHCRGECLDLPGEAAIGLLFCEMLIREFDELSLLLLEIEARLVQYSIFTPNLLVRLKETGIERFVVQTELVTRSSQLVERCDRLGTDVGSDTLRRLALLNGVRPHCVELRSRRVQSASGFLHLRRALSKQNVLILQRRQVILFLSVCLPKMGDFRG
mmetsp:Transcript_37287/g.86689  ORF Transcript_37287/g.86689 Transcript_37287/m.86689 type:complete len:217 (+) Transcript_37287:580-1230(+)